MKNTFLHGLLIMVSFTLMSSTCSSDDDVGNPNDNSQEIVQIENIVVSGSWQITSYVDSGQDETNDYNGFNFTFGTDESLTAINDTTVYEGTWSVTSNSNDDSNDDDIDFNISFLVPETNDFEDLNDDWDIVMHSSTRIDLIDISGGNGGTDTLTFEKN